MALNPINLGVRFLLELGILAGLAIWGWRVTESPWHFALAIGVPLAAALLWGTFRVPNDPGAATVAVPGIVRLLLELALFTAGAVAFYAAGLETTAFVFAGLVAIHYLVSYDRVLWLLSGPATPTLG